MSVTSLTVAEIIALCDPPLHSEEPRLHTYLGINRRTQDHWHIYGNKPGIPEKYWEAVIDRAWVVSKTKLTVQQIYDANKLLRDASTPA